MSPKGKYSLSLDQDAMDKLKVWVDKNGMTLSGYINTIVVENVKALERMKLPDDLNKVTLGDFMKMFSGMMTGFNQDKEESKQKPEKKKK